VRSCLEARELQMEFSKDLNQFSSIHTYVCVREREREKALLDARSLFKVRELQLVCSKNSNQLSTTLSIYMRMCTYSYVYTHA